MKKCTKCGKIHTTSEICEACGSMSFVTLTELPKVETKKVETEEQVERIPIKKKKK